MQFAPNADGHHWDATALAALAVARHGLGQTEQAAATLDRAKAILAAKMPDPAKGRPFGVGDFHDWLHSQTLCRKAEGLLKAKPPTPAPAAPAPAAQRQQPR